MTIILLKNKVIVKPEKNSQNLCANRILHQFRLEKLAFLLKTI